MIKTIFLYSFIFFTLFYISFSLHNYFLEENQVLLPFSLKKVYLFHLGFSMLICINFKLLSSVNKIADQLGFIYLGTLLLKIVLFSIIFYQSIFTEEELSKISRISLLIPALIFLLTEAIFVAKILNKRDISKIP
ncbi:DUF6168 family protein [Polaribacter marinivivus]|uniref:DUF6168 family protein n=1 Tax=Polaribacter marinivivus TaxID=1524260 RepID=A0ABV8R9E3_9FLAO